MRRGKTDRYLKRAEKARRHAEEMAEEASQRLMLRIAREYEDFAKLQTSDEPDGSPIAA